jgi:four helix bundle protein
MERCIENLFIWQESRKVVNGIYAIMTENRDFGFKDQIQRAAVFIMNNIAEGFESGSDAKFINFLNIAKGSCSEVRSMLYLCEDFKYCSIEERTELQKQIKQISTGIVNLIEKIKFSQNCKSTSR